MPSGVNLLSISRPVAMVVVIAVYMAHVDRDLPIMALLAVAAAFFVATSAILVNWIPVPPKWGARVLWLEMAVVIGVNLATVDLNPGGPAQILFTAPAVNICLTLERRQWLAATLVIIAGWIITWLSGAAHLELIWVIAGVGLYGSLLAFAGGAGLLVRTMAEQKQSSDNLLVQYQESQAALERMHRQLRESVARQQEMAVLEERQRLAREIHDSVAHSLTALVVQLQAARRLQERAPGQAATALAHCEETAREALLETRRAVRALHPAGLEQQTDLEALRRLARDFGAAAGISVEVSGDEGSAKLPPDPARLEQLYRICQEALTNAHRHGQAKQVRLHLACGNGHVRLTIANDGLPPTTLEPGIGLKSMAERVRAMGGTIAMEPGAAGLTITVTVPAAQEAV